MFTVKTNKPVTIKAATNINVAKRDRVLTDEGA